MNNDERAENPSRASAVDSKSTSTNSKALRYIAYGVYLQLFLGVGVLAIPAVGVDAGPLFDGPRTCGALLVGLGLNSLIYINRYKKSLR